MMHLAVRASPQRTQASAHHAEPSASVPKPLASLLRRRKELEDRRVKQLLKIAHALDAVAREEFDLLKKPDGAKGVEHDDIPVTFVDSADSLGTVE